MAQQHAAGHGEARGGIRRAGSPSQLTLMFEPGVSAQHRSLRACMAAGVYAAGLDRIAARVDESPSKLGEKLAGGSGDRTRDVGLDLFERYLDATGDLTPIYYLVDKFLRDPDARHAEALAKLARLADELPALLNAAGFRR